MSETTPAPEPAPFFSVARIFLVIWSGQLVSVCGTQLSAFALGVWVYQQTGSVTQYAFISFAVTLPMVVISPFAGVLVDRWNRRLAMIAGDVGAAAGSAALLGLVLTDRLEIWHLYVALFLAACCNALQVPAYNSAVTQLVPKEHFDRANGMVQLAQGLAQLTAPLLGALLLVSVGVPGVLTLDLVTFTVAVATLLAVRIPDVRRDAETPATMLADVRSGFAYLRQRPGLLALLGTFGFCNFLIGVAAILVTPMVLAFTSEVALGTILTVGGLGMVAGGAALSALGGTRDRVRVIAASMVVCGLFIAMAGLRPSSVLIAGSAFGFFAALIVINTTGQTLVQRKVAPELQGRVFAIMNGIAMASLPIAYPLAGPFGDALAPLLRPGGPLAASLGGVFGVGEGRGLGLGFVILGILMVLAAAVAWSFPRFRKLESEVPDAVADEEPAQESTPTS